MYNFVEYFRVSVHTYIRNMCRNHTIKPCHEYIKLLESRFMHVRYKGNLAFKIQPYVGKLHRVIFLLLPSVLNVLF